MRAPRLQSAHGRRPPRGDRRVERDVAGRPGGRRLPAARRRAGRRRGALAGAGDGVGGLPGERPAGVRAAAAQRQLDHHGRRDGPAGRARRGLPGCGAAGVVVRVPRRRPRGRRRDVRPPRRGAAERAVDLPPRDRRRPRRPPGLAPGPRPARPGPRALRRVAARDGGGVRRPAGAGGVRPGDRRAADARRRPARRARAVAVRAGVRAFHLGPQVRPGGSRKAYVDADLVRSWRLLVDDARRRRTGR